MSKLKYLVIASYLVSAFYAGGCSSKRTDANNPQDLVNDAEEDIKDKRYIIALDKLKNVKNKFPYSHMATQAQIRIADVYFVEESYIEAAGAYETFREMHPKHEKSDYVLFRIGESYFLQLPDSSDRDHGPATKAIEAYRELIGLYPKSQYVNDAKAHLKDATEKLAEKERYVADFYYTRDMYDSAALRFEKIVTQFPNTSVEQEAYWNWAQSLMKQDKTDEVKHVLKLYISRYPAGEYAKSAGDWLEQHER